MGWRVVDEPKGDDKSVNEYQTKRFPSDWGSRKQALKGVKEVPVRLMAA
jgi:hypothetical protein